MASAETESSSVVWSIRMPHEVSAIDLITVDKNFDYSANVSSNNRPPTPPLSTRPNEPVANLRPPPALPPRPKSRSGARSPVSPPEATEITSSGDLDGTGGLVGLEVEPPAPELEHLVCVVCMAPTTTRCSRCKLEGYCAREHQVLDWARHANLCVVAEENLGVDECNDIDNTNEPHPLSSPELPLRPGRTILVDAILLPADEELPRIVQVKFEVLNYRHTALDLERFLGSPPSEKSSSSGPGLARWRAARVRTVHIDWIEHQWKGGPRLDGGARLSVHFRYDPDAPREHRCLAKTVLGPRLGASLGGLGHSVLKRGDMLVLKHSHLSREVVVNALLSDYVYVGEYYRGLWSV